jgi:hypothetical protein
MNAYTNLYKTVYAHGRHGIRSHLNSANAQVPTISDTNITTSEIFRQKSSIASTSTPIFTKLGRYIVPPEAISTAYTTFLQIVAAKE